MLRASYGTGIHLIRNNSMEHVFTTEARYVPELDSTLVGSRSAANAAAVWMFLQSSGYEGGQRFRCQLVERTQWLCAELRHRGIRFFHQPGMNVVAMRSEDIPGDVSAHFILVPDSHTQQPQWVKAVTVIMDHVDRRLRQGSP